MVSWNIKFIEHKDNTPQPLCPGNVINDNKNSDSGDDSSDEDTHVWNTGPESIGDPTYDMIVDTIVNEQPPTSSDGTEPQPSWCSAQKAVPSTAGGVMKGIQIESHMERAIREARETSIRICTVKAAWRKVTVEANLDQDHLLGIVYEEEDPLMFLEAMNQLDAEEWKKGIEAELKSIGEHEVWMKLPRSEIPQGKKAVKSKFVFHLKCDSKGKVVQHKVCLVARGFTQIEGVDYTNTFSPVAWLESFRTILTLAATQDWEMCQLNVKTAFLHGELEEETYMEFPQGIPDKAGCIVQLYKGLYGLKQANHYWNKKLDNTMLKYNYLRMSVDHCIYQQISDMGESIVAIHVDDMVAVASDTCELDWLVCDLCEVFNIMDLGDVWWLLGISIILLEIWVPGVNGIWACGDKSKRGCMAALQLNTM